MSSFTEELEYEFTGSYLNGNPIYVITKDFSYALGSLESPIHVFNIPAGYLTDMASIPFPINLLFKPNGPWAKAAVLHDYITGEFFDISRIVADGVFLEAMTVLKINLFIAYLFYFAVRFAHL